MMYGPLQIFFFHLKIFATKNELSLLLLFIYVLIQRPAKSNNKEKKDTNL